MYLMYVRTKHVKQMCTDVGIGYNYIWQFHSGWKNEAGWIINWSTETICQLCDKWRIIQISIKSTYSVLDYLWSDDDDFDFLVTFIKPDYKIFRKNFQNLKNNNLSDDITSCYLDELIVSSKKVNNILILESIILDINFSFVTNKFTTNFPEYLCNNNSVNPSLYFLLLKRNH